MLCSKRGLDTSPLLPNDMKNRVLFVLVIGLVLSTLGLPFLTHAPNRLVTGTGISLLSLIDADRAWVVAPLFGILVSPWLPSTPVFRAWTLIGVSLAIAAFLWVAGDEARRLVGDGAGFGRTSFGGGFWLACLASWLIGAQTASRMSNSQSVHAGIGLGLLLPSLALMLSGALNETSLLKEYFNREDVFREALSRHLLILGLSLFFALVIGVPLGVRAFRHPGAGGGIFASLNVIQTIPSIAMFGLLIAPLAALAAASPILADLGVAGIGVAPAVIALTLYSLLPVARGVHAGLRQVPASVVEAAQGMGLTRGQILWKVEFPIALPVFLSGLRVAAVQAVGLVMVAALVGAGGFGALMFQGLASSALDLVLLGVIPVVILAVLIDALFKSVVSVLEGARQ